MKNDTLFRKYHRRIAREGIVKSLLYGLIAGSCALLVSALLSWFFGFKGGLWLAIGLFVLGVTATSLLLYFLKFRPTSKEIAVRVDALGLEERLLTMLELEGDDSYIASRQREDAIHAMQSVDSMLLKIVISISLIVALVVSLVVGLAGGTTISSLYYSGAIPSGIALVRGEEFRFTYTCTYSVGTGYDTGYIVYWTREWADGKEEAVPVTGAIEVTQGEDAPAVYALPSEGFIFVSWSDGVRSPYREDLDVNGTIDVSATFAYIGDFYGYGFVDDLYLDLSGGGGGKPNYPDWLEDQPEPEPDPDQETPENDVPHDMSNAQIYDSNHYYGDFFNDAYDSMQDRLNADSSISDEMKGYISDYMDNIGTKASEEGEDEDDDGSSGAADRVTDAAHEALGG